MLRRKFEQSRYFEDFTLGESFYIPSRTMATPRWRPSGRPAAITTLHYDMEYAKERGFPSILVHPLQMLLYTTPAPRPSYLIEDTLVTFVGQSSRFVKPVFGAIRSTPVDCKRLEPSALGGGSRWPRPLKTTGRSW